MSRRSTSLVILAVALATGCSNAPDDAGRSPKEVSEGLRRIEQCLTNRGSSTEDVASRIRSNPKFRAAVDECGGDSGVGADEVLAADSRITKLNNQQVRKDQTCMRRGGFEIATYTDRTGTLHMEDFDSKYVNPSNVDRFFDVYADCVDLPRSNFPSSNGFPTTTVSPP